MKRMISKKLKEFAFTTKDVHDQLWKIYEYYIDTHPQCPMSEDVFYSKADSWTFFGTVEGGVITRVQNSGLIKIIAIYGSARQITNGIYDMFASSNNGVWGFVDDDIAPKFYNDSPVRMVSLDSDFVLEMKSIFENLINYSDIKTGSNFPQVQIKYGGCFATQLFVCDKKYLLFLLMQPDLTIKQKDMIDGIISNLF